MQTGVWHKTAGFPSVTKFPLFHKIVLPMNEERKAQIKESFHRSKMMDLFGAEMTQLSKSYIEITIRKKDFMVRPAGMFNGSVIATLVDVSSGYAAVSAQKEDSYFTTVELKINYLRPAIGAHLVAKAQVIKSGKVLTVVRSDIYACTDARETLAATSLVTLMKLGKSK